MILTLSSDMFSCFWYSLQGFFRDFFLASSVWQRIDLLSMFMILFISIRFSQSLDCSRDLPSLLLVGTLCPILPQELSTSGFELMSLMQWLDRLRTSSWKPVLWCLRCGFIIDKIICLQMRRDDRIKRGEGSAQWSQVLYRVQLATGRASIKLLNVYSYPILVERSSNDPSVRAVVDTTDLKPQFKDMVVSKQVPIEDVLFICGHINLERFHQHNSKVFSFLLCDIAVGNIAPQPEGVRSADSLLIEPEYNDPFHYNMLLKSYKQYQVTYECDFMLGDPRDVGEEPPLCSFCGNRRVSVYCKDQKVHFCEACSRQRHLEGIDRTREKDMPRTHRLQPLDKRNNLPICEVHKQRHEIYCLKCEAYLCPECLQHHPHRRNDDHPTRPIEFLYTEKRQANARMAVKPKDQLNKLLQICRDKEKVLLANYNQVRNGIVAEFERAMRELEHYYNTRVVLVQGDVTRIEMELDRIQWNLMFLKVQEEALKPIHYFRIQRRMEEDMKNLKTSGYRSVEVQPDIDQYSFIRVGDKKTISELRQELAKKQEDRQVQSGPRREEETAQAKKKGEKWMIYNPEGAPTQKGELTLMLENSKMHFFRVKRVNE